MSKTPFSRKRIVLAFAVAGVADLLQLPITAATLTGVLAIPGEMADIVIDCLAMAATTALLGFHWVLLPSFLMEAIPGIDLLPTWTGCVAWVVFRQQKGPAQTPPPVTEIEATPVRTLPEPPGKNVPPKIGG